MATVDALTIGGTTVKTYVQGGTLRQEKTSNRRSVLQMVLRDKQGGAATYRPTIREQVNMLVNAAQEFFGIVWSVTERPIIDYVGVEVSVDCVDYAALAEVTLFNGVIPSTSLRNAVSVLCQNLLVHGISMDPAQASGPTVTDQGIPFATIAEAFNSLSRETGWVWRINNSRLVQFYEPGTVAAPFALNAAVTGDIMALEVSRSLDNYVNGVWLQFGEGTHQATQRFIGNGAAREFRLNYDLLEPLPLTVTVNRAGVVTQETTALYGSGVSAEWYYDRANTWNQRWFHDAGETVLSASDYVEFVFQAQFPGAVFAGDGAEAALYGTFYVVEQRPEIFSYDSAVLEAESILRQRGGTPRRVKLTTGRAGFAPLQTVTVTDAKRDITAVEFLILSVETSHQIIKPPSGGVDQHHLTYTLDLLEGNERQGNWLDFYLPEDTRGFGTVPPSGAGGVGGETPPNTSPTSPEYVTDSLRCYPTGASGVTLPTSATDPNWTYSAWVEVVPASTIASEFLIAGFQIENVKDSVEMEVEFALGLSGQEVRYGTFRMGGNVNESQCICWLPIPFGPVHSGTRVSVRQRSDALSASAVSMLVKCLYYSGPPAGITYTLRELKTSSPGARAPQLNPGETWADGAWVEIEAATSEEWQVAGMCLSMYDISIPIAGDEIEVDLGIGGSGSEVAVTTWRFNCRQTGVVSQGVINDPVLIGAVPIGSRVALRSRHSSTTATTTRLRITVSYYGGSL
jgi:hypothetical protein